MTKTALLFTCGLLLLGLPVDAANCARLLRQCRGFTVLDVAGVSKISENSTYDKVLSLDNGMVFNLHSYGYASGGDDVTVLVRSYGRFLAYKLIIDTDVCDASRLR
jgi:hypothetical protein